MNSPVGQLVGSSIITVFFLLLCQGQETRGDKRCKKIVLMPEKEGYFLRYHSILNLTDVTPDVCKIMCYMNESCMSYNYCTRWATCEINDSDHYNYPYDLIRKAGFVYVGTENACSSKPCPNNFTCRPNFYTQSFSCLCPHGFSGINCSDIDECKISSHNCSINHTCINTAGSYDCICKPGYQPHGIYCFDIDECSTGAHDCSQVGSLCLNTEGSFECECSDGYEIFKNKCTKILGNYEVIVHTGKMLGAGTDAAVYIKLHGSHFNKQAITSKKLLSGRFERNLIDKSTLEGLLNMESLSKITVGHDSTGRFPAWYLNKVIVDNKTRRMQYTFQCDCWISLGDLSSRDIEPKKDILGKTIVTRY